MDNTQERKLIKGVCLETGEHIEYYEGETPNSPTIGACQAVPENLFTPDMLKTDEYRENVAKHEELSRQATEKKQSEQTNPIE